VQLRRWRNRGAECPFKESPMSIGSARGGMGGTATRAAVLAAIFTMTLAMVAPAWAQAPAPSTTPPPAQAAPDNAQSADLFGEEISLPAKTIVYIKGSGSWDKAFDTITNSFKQIKTYLDKEGIKPDGLSMTIFTATDDAGFEYQAAVPIAQAPKNPPHGDIAIGQSPEGKALKFIHRGSYDDLDNTYEAITNYLDDKRLEAKDMFIEEYVTDPLTADATKLVVNVYVLIKPTQTAPG
jgi:effector-binding domain-containing protein